LREKAGWDEMKLKLLVAYWLVSGIGFNAYFIGKYGQLRLVESAALMVVGGALAPSIGVLYGLVQLDGIIITHEATK